MSAETTVGKTRIVETDDGRYMPQIKTGWFWGWKFLSPRADKAGSMLLVWLKEDDPAKAAQFKSEGEARDFLDRFESNVAMYWSDWSEAQARKMEGIRIKRTFR